MQWALNNYDPQVYNHSYGNTSSPGTVDAMDQFLDQFSISNAEIQIKSAGNSASYISHPGNGYNTLTVGAFDDKNTIPRSGDTMATFSNYLDPTSAHGDRNKPEVVAPGVNLRVKLLGPPLTSLPVVLQQGSGTSFAAPQVAGLAALIQNMGSGIPASSDPRVHKAAIMATAIFDVEAGTDRDGVGGVSAGKFNQIVDGSRASSWVVSASSTFDISVNLQRGLQAGIDPKMRVVLVWEENPSGAHRPGMPYPAYPQNDWDLLVYKPSGPLVASSASWDNTYEVTEFTVTESGTWTFGIYNVGDSGIPSFMAIFWVPIP
jgi:subtilisin family serine protease